MNKRIKKIGIALLVVPSIQLIASIFSQVQAGETVFSSADNNLILTSSALVLLMTQYIFSKNVLLVQKDYLNLKVK